MPVAMTDEIDIASIERGFGGYTRELGQRYVAHGDDWVEVALDYDPRFAMGANGVLASGPILSLIDGASGLSIIAKVKRQRPMATLDLRVDYLRTAEPGATIHARATCYRVTRQVAFVRCDAHSGDPGDPVATSLSSFFFTAD